MSAASHAFEDGISGRSGFGFAFMSTTLFSAFSAEAYFNHIGQQRIAYWSDHLERSLTPIGKAVFLNHNLLDRTIDLGSRPYQSLVEAIAYRNALAHGKTETVKSEGVQRMRPNQEVTFPRVKWRKCMERATAERLMNDVRQIVTTLHADLGGRGNPFSYLGTGSYSKKSIPTT
jgi:hypothetical protein